MALRCFVAIELDTMIHENLSALRKQLQSELWGNDKGIKWVKPDNIHLTLKFLGDVDDNRIIDLCQACDAAAAEHSPFDFEVCTAGTFPPAGAARVIWAGINSGLQNLSSLFNSVEEHCEQAGFDKEGRKFSPHITLARIKLAETGKYVSNMVNSLETLPFGCQGVEAITIFSSTLEPDGPTYDIIHRSQLK